MRPLNMLYRSSQTVVRTRAPGRVLHALFSYLSAHVDGAADQLLRSASLGIVVGGEAILIPRAALHSLKTVQPRLHRLGAQLVDAPYSTLDPETGSLVVPPPAIEVDHTVVDAIDRASDSEPPRVVPGRYPLRAWALLLGPDEIGPSSPAKAVGAAFSTVDAERVGAQATLEALAAIFQKSHGFAVWYSDPTELVTQLQDVIRP